MPGVVARTNTLIGLTLAVLLAAPAARAETTACLVVGSLPAVLDTTGHYCLESDFTQSFAGAAIQVNADDIVLDCNGHRIRNTLSTNTAAGIAGFNRNGATVRNCVVDGFSTGISWLATSDGYGDANHFEGNQVLNARQIGIYFSGSHNLVERNKVTRVTGNYNGVVYGIFLQNFASGAVGNVIRDNVISDFQPAPPPGESSTTNGIFFGSARNTVLSGNTISGLYAVTGRWVNAIESYGTQTTATGNTILSAPPLPAPLDGGQSGGIMLFGTLEEQAGSSCRDNIVGSFTTDISGCVKSVNTEF